MSPRFDSDDVRRLTLGYYDEHASAYDERTRNADLTEVYAPFLALIPEGGRVLDAGCATGRDSAEFIKRGYDVTAFDGSRGLAAIAQERLSRPVRLLTFQAMAFEDEFDGVWACASFLHVPSKELPLVLERVRRALRPSGVLYASFKHGTAEGLRAGRWFTDQTEGSIETLLNPRTGWEAVRIWTSPDSEGRDQVTWLNALFRRT
jgi:SAM-dependent methyltransferase